MNKTQNRAKTLIRVLSSAALALICAHAGAHVTSTGRYGLSPDHTLTVEEGALAVCIASDGPSETIPCVVMDNMGAMTTNNNALIGKCTDIRESNNQNTLLCTSKKGGDGRQHKWSVVCDKGWHEEKDEQGMEVPDGGFTFRCGQLDAGGGMR